MAADMEASMFSMFSMFNMHVRACVHVHVCVHGTAPHTPIPTPTPIHPSATPRISKNSITLELIKIFQFHLKIWNLWRIPHPWVGVWFGGFVGGWVGWWVGWWVGSGQNTKNLKNVWLNQDNSILFEDLWFVETPPPMGGCVGGWVDGWVNGWGQVKWLKL